MKLLSAGLVSLLLIACSATAKFESSRINHVRFERATNQEGAPALVEGKIGQGGLFKKNRLSFADFEKVQEHTVAAWIYVPELGPGPYPMLIMEKASAYYMNVQTQDGKWGKRKGHLRAGGHYTDGTKTKWEYIDSPTPIPLNKWIHVAYTQAKGHFKLYLNGDLVAQKQILPQLLDTNLELTWGALWKAQEQRYKWWFHGRLDEGMIFNRALAPEEVHRLYQGNS